MPFVPARRQHAGKGIVLHGSPAIFNDGDYMTTLDVLAKEVGILGIFSDWPGTVSLLCQLHGSEADP